MEIEHIYMKVINQFLREHYPSHPNDTVVTNKWYPQGLSELSIYKYYLSKKNDILNWIGDRRVAFLLKLSDTHNVLIRNQKGSPIYVTESNFEQIITGRTNVIYVEHPSETDYWVIDIDIGPNLNMNHTKKAQQILVHKLESTDVKKMESILSSPRGIHVIGHLHHKENIDTLRHSLREKLQQICNELNQKSKIKFVVNVKGRQNNTINFDLSSMYPRSLHIARYSLTKEFLISDSIERGLKKVHTL